MGVSIVRADGAIVRGGGKVVKNVAGFDLPKLMVGSLGTLGAIVRATFRLHPQPETTASVVVSPCDAARAFEVHRALVEERMEPAAVLAVAHGNAPNAYDVLVTFEGFARGVAAQRDALLALAQRSGWHAEPATARDAERIESAHAAARANEGIAIEVRALPAAFEGVQRAAIEPLAAVLHDARIAGYPTLGFTFVAGSKAQGEATPARRSRKRARPSNAAAGYSSCAPLPRRFAPRSTCGGHHRRRSA